MLTVAPPEAGEVRANATFEALMWALARPGDIRALPEPGLGQIVEALVDLECSAHGDSPELRRVIAEAGAEVAVHVAMADHVFIERFDGDVDSLMALRCGSALYPDDGATVVIAAGLGEGQRLRLSGPGVEAPLELAVALPAAIWRLREQLCLYPEGFDLFVVDGPRVLGLPRSTTIEVL